MKEVKVKIKGIKPLLQNRITLENLKTDGRVRRQIDEQEEIESKLYRNSNGCYIPSTYIEGCLKKAGSYFKYKGNLTFKQLMKSVIVEPDEIPLGKKTYDEIDIRPANIRGNFIACRRPKFNDWKVEFSIIFNENIMSTEDIKRILEYAGNFIGIGAYRPKFGRFKIISFE